MPREFNEMFLRLASPERILEWSYGEVTKPETINYRTQRSEKNGLFDEKIFGPEKDFECYCGKYRGIRYRGIICEKCGVEVTRSIVRRERMGHIELATPVAHIWFLRNIPSRMALLLGVSAPDLEKVVYFAAYIVTAISEDERVRLLKDLESEYKSKTKSLQDAKSKSALKEAYLGAKRDIQSIRVGSIIDDATYARFSMKYGSLFEAATGAEAIHAIFNTIDLKKLAKEVEAELAEGKAADSKKLKKRLSLINAMIRSKVRPEWMFVTILPVIPAAIRPMVALEGGRHATSDLNDLYRRVINRNNRLKKLVDIKAPAVILRNEKRILQEAVDALIDNSMRQGSSYSVMSQAQRRPLKSLADNLSRKQGIFRQNLLGKRVDYSGRSVIVVGPELHLDQCGLPKHMALELFRPFVIQKLLEREYAFNIRGAGRLIDERTPEVWEILEEVITDKYVLLNRAPTLHRLGIQAFRPVLIEGEAIQIHPLVVQAFNADFDGDQMAVHVPLSKEAQKEAEMIMSASRNLLRPGSGAPIVSIAHQDIILGCYWMTKIVEGEKGEGKAFESPNAAITAFNFDNVSLRAKIFVKPTGKEKYSPFGGNRFETSIGRLLFNGVLPDDYAFINAEITKKEMGKIVATIIARYDHETVTEILDKIKAFGFRYTTASGITFGLGDIPIPKAKKELVDRAIAASGEVHAQYEDGLLSEDERYRQNIEIWHGLRAEMERAVDDTLDAQSSINDMWRSGARGSLSQITNMAGMKGLIAGPQGRIIEFPILSSNKEGLTPIEYFITTHGSRKGLGDTALNTSRSGYLTRRLFDVSQDVVITEEDCKTKGGIVIKHQNLGGIEVPLTKGLAGRFLADTVKDTDGTILFKRNDYMTEEYAETIASAGIEEVFVRSPMTCESVEGICVRCYGRDMGRNDPVSLGEAVGTIAAQSIGEPATQLTMRTFHAGGTASVGGDIVQGLPRVEEIFECRPPKNPAIIADVAGTVTDIIDTGKEKIITVLSNATDIKKKKEGKTEATEYGIHRYRMSLVKKGDTVEKGELLTDGSADLQKLFKLAGKEKTQEYIISEISKIYELQGASVARPHIEVIVRQMFSRYKVTHSGDTDFSVGDVVEQSELTRVNEEINNKGGTEAKARQLIMGIASVALSRRSFLSAASFQNTNRVLIDAALRGSSDPIKGLKENVIVGRLIPAGTGYAGSPKWELVHNLRDEEDVDE
ncbi:DNA-directed RNA polymerase subunit beta' [Candidatus Wolfebacteria bacterium]|nr:DNA-directed RNA polymerase subunit beta' [Candidatus Wolfebacteria bacterium]